ncbi:SepM family pheromone-processing serine protease [Bacillus sp. 31A1R]|uniref:endopeptidase La n=1 Tax=Robertmurraya mangrovi TaxID=3098077 RepID=A0ABU5IU61_9BACI|nr:SepM family pheromone-processing serine protease [Bacillus sp. 31A1R]MDZ5470679.1 SepM family pheromone-processing serine protease [Bacillus sp. 31A1R]
MNKKFYMRSLMVFVAMIIFISTFYSLPYYVSKPGMAKELAPIIEVENGFEEEGSFMLTTVRMGRANIYSYLLAKVKDYQEIYPIEAIRQEEETDEEYNVRQLHLMSSSKTSAIEVAYKKAGIPINYHYKGVYVLNVMKGMPAEGKLQPGDRIFKIDDMEFKSSEEFIQYVGSKKAGDEIVLTYDRGNRTNSVKLNVQSFGENIEKVGVGIGLVDDKEIEVDPEVKVETSDIGGPSAGLMFSLEIYNQLTKVDLTRGYEIAGTGTISSDGRVGRIGGIEQKVIAADNAGAEIFLAPYEDGADDSNYHAAVKTAKDIKTKMKIVPANTFDEVVEQLIKLEPK